MGFFYAVKGWFETINPEHFHGAKEFIERNDQSGYARNWVFSAPVVGSCPNYVFYGGEVRDVSLADVRAVIRGVAETVRSLDGDLVDHISGYFHADAEDGSVLLVWECRDGECREHRRPPATPSPLG